MHLLAGLRPDPRAPFDEPTIFVVSTSPLSLSGPSGSTGGVNVKKTHSFVETTFLLSLANCGQPWRKLPSPFLAVHHLRLHSYRLRVVDRLEAMGAF